MGGLHTYILIGLVASALGQGALGQAPGEQHRIRSVGRLRDSAVGPQIVDETVMNGVPDVDAEWAPATDAKRAGAVQNSAYPAQESTVISVEATGELSKRLRSIHPYKGVWHQFRPASASFRLLPARAPHTAPRRKTPKSNPPKE
jgi:hypothetical protein